MSMNSMESVVTPEIPSVDLTAEMEVLAEVRGRAYREENAFTDTLEARLWRTIASIDPVIVPDETNDGVDKKDIAQAKTLNDRLQLHRQRLIAGLPRIDYEANPATAEERFIYFAQFSEFGALDLQRIGRQGDIEAARTQLKSLGAYIDNHPERYSRELLPPTADNYGLHVADFDNSLQADVLYLCRNQLLQTIQHYMDESQSHIAQREEYALLLPQLPTALQRELFTALCQHKAALSTGEGVQVEDYVGRLTGETLHAVKQMVDEQHLAIARVYTTTYIFRDQKYTTTFGRGATPPYNAKLRGRLSPEAYSLHLPLGPA